MPSALHSDKGNRILILKTANTADTILRYGIKQFHRYHDLIKLVIEEQLMKLQHEKYAIGLFILQRSFIPEEYKEIGMFYISVRKVPRLTQLYMQGNPDSSEEMCDSLLSTLMLK